MRSRSTIRGLAARNVTLEAAFPDPTETVRQFDTMPSFDVSVSLKSAYQRNPLHAWTPNDLIDIDALGSTLLYCDLVLTDKAAAHAARSVAVRPRRTSPLRPLGVTWTRVTRSSRSDKCGAGRL